MCTQCGDREPGRRFQVDGSTSVLCGPCVRENIRIAAAHETIRRIHKAAHGYDSPCPTCEADTWLQGQRLAENIEMALERSKVQAEFTADLDIRRLRPRIRRVA